LKALIITGNKYPCDDAGALRQHAFARIFQQLGYDVFVMGYGKPTAGKVRDYEGVDYISFRPDSENVFVRAFYRFIFGWRALRYIKINHAAPDVIMVVSLPPNDMKRIEHYSKKRKIKLVHDSVEWYSPEEFKNKSCSIEYRNNNQLNSKVIRNGWRVIAISKYLEEHFRNVCDATVRIPVILDVKNIPLG